MYKTLKCFISSSATQTAGDYTGRCGLSQGRSHGKKWQSPGSHTRFHFSRDDTADVDQVHLPAVAAVGRVDDDALAVRTEARVRVTAPLARILRRREKVAEHNLATAFDVKEKHRLISVLIGIAVVDDPFIPIFVINRVLLDNSTGPPLPNTDLTGFSIDFPVSPLTI